MAKIIIERLFVLQGPFRCVEIDHPVLLPASLPVSPMPDDLAQDYAGMRPAIA